MKSKYLLRFLALGYLALLLGIPVALVFVNAFQDGVGAAWDAVTTPEAKHAFYLTMVMVAVAVPLNTIFGVRSVDPKLFEAAAMLGCDGSRMFRQVVLPAATPSIFNGLRLAHGFAWILIVVGEMTGVPTGLGSVIMDGRTLSRTDLVVTGMIVIGVAGFATHAGDGGVNWLILLAGLAGAIPGGWLGARATGRVDENALRLVLGVVARGRARSAARYLPDGVGIRLRARRWLPRHVPEPRGTSGALATEWRHRAECGHGRRRAPALGAHGRAISAVPQRRQMARCPAPRRGCSARECA